MAILGIVICMPRVFPCDMPTFSQCKKAMKGGARPESSLQRELSCREAKWRVAMTGFKTLMLASLISTVSVASALAQEPAAFQSMYPNRDVLNGGALTPAG